MLPDLRFLLGATLATALLGVVAVGLATTVRLSHQTRISPLEAARSLAYAARESRNGPSDPELTRTFEALARTSASNGTDATPAQSTPMSASEPPPAASIDEAASNPPQMALPHKMTERAPASDSDAAPPAASEIAPTTRQASTSAKPTGAADVQPLPDVTTDRPPSETPSSASTAEAVPTPALPSASAPIDTTATQAETMADTPAADARAADPSAADPPVAEQPVAEAPVIDAPVTETPVTEPTTAETTPAATVPPSQAPPDSTPTADTSAPKSVDQVEQVGSIEATTPADSTDKHAGEKHAGEKDAVAPAAEPTKALPHPAPKARRVIRATRARAPKKAQRIAKARPKAPVRARTTVRQPTAWTGYPPTRQRPTSWGWDFSN